MPQVLSSGTWYTISDVATMDDGRIMSFKLRTQEHGLVTVEANVPWQDWQKFLNFAGRSVGGAGVGAAFGPVGAVIGAAAGIVSFFKSYEDNSPGYVHRASGSRYFNRLYNTRDTSTYRP